MHDLRGAPHVKDIRNLGLVAGVELEPRPGQPGVRAYEAFLKCLERGVLVRYTGDILAFSPPLIISEAEIDQLFDTVRQALNDVQ
ncbi:Omega-amino acid--pyruvate aminotransferase [compost metagenome]